MRNWLRRFSRPSDEDFAVEIDTHLAHEVDEQIERGLPPKEAHYAALRRFGNVTRHLERFREASPWFRLDTLWQDVQYGWRSLWGTPVLTVVAILSLGLGIGANAAIYTVARAVLLDPLRLPGAHRVFVVREQNNALSFMPPMPLGQLEGIRRLGRSIGSIGVTTTWTGTVRYGDAGPTTEIILFADDLAAQALGFEPMLGRWPTMEEQRSGAPVAVLTSRLGERPDLNSNVLGRQMRISNVEFTIIGVTPPAFHGLKVGLPCAAIVPFRSLEMLGPGTLAASITASMVGRLAPGESMQRAAQQVAAWRFDTADAKARATRLELLPINDAVLPAERRARLTRALGGLSALAGVVLLLGCCNVASAMLARSERRRQELAMRITLGASRARLVRLLGIECVLLTVLSTTTAIVFSHWMVQAFPASLALGWKWVVVPVAVPLDLTKPVVVFTAALGAASLLVFGIGPALRVTRVDPMAALRVGADARHTTTSRSRRLLLTAQVAASGLLLTGAFLLGQTVANGTAMDLGFGQRGALVFARVTFQSTRNDPSAIVALRRRLAEQLAGHSSFLSAAFTTSPVPFHPILIGDRVEVDSVERVPASHELGRFVSGGRVFAEYADPAYRASLGLPLLYGRDLVASDARSGEPAVLINEALARQFWPEGNAVGSQLKVHVFGEGWVPATRPARIVGVVGNARYDVTEGSAPCVYFLNDGTDELPVARATGGVYVRMSGDAQQATAWVRNVVHSVTPDEPPPLVLSRDDYLAAELAVEHLLLHILAWFACVALVLSVIGVYGLTADGVARRTKEIAVRLALGASDRSIVVLVTRAATAATMLGAAIGVFSAAIAASVLHSLVFSLNPFSPVAYFAASLLLFGVALVASAWPAARAVRIPPADALRAE